MKLRIVFMSVLAVFVLAVLTPGVQAQTKYPRPETYIPTWSELEKHKKTYDDSRPALKDWGFKNMIPKEYYDKITFDQEKMKSLWAEIVGFKAPDVVGKVHSEIKPGKYTYKDVQANPAFKTLMYPDLYNRIGPGGLPYQFAGRMPEFEIIPTRQYYFPLPIAEMTKKNMSKVKLDANGYLIQSTWEGGYPFPKPSGPFKAQQVMYNLEKNYMSFGMNHYMTCRLIGYNGSMKIDFDGKLVIKHMRLTGRAVEEPFGYYDTRAKQLREMDQILMTFEAPRDQAGQAVQMTKYSDNEKPDQNLVYIPAFRRIRKMSGTDTQDAIGGQDIIYDDTNGWAQKLTPNRYPYKFEILEEREYLTVAPTVDGAEWISSKNSEFKNIRLERRPLYVVRLTQLDKNYVYSKRLIYLDKETFYLHHIENYDQKGRLYRTAAFPGAWIPEAGATVIGLFAPALARDHVDTHSTIELQYIFPAVYNRDDLKIAGGQGQK